MAEAELRKTITKFLDGSLEYDFLDVDSLSDTIEALQDQQIELQHDIEMMRAIRTKVIERDLSNS